MENKQREIYLKIGVAIVVGLFVLDRFILTPAIAHWKDQSENIATLRTKVQRGRQLIEREKSIRERWNEMIRTQLPEDRSVAEGEVYKAIGRWSLESRINFNNLVPIWTSHPEGYDTFQCRVTAAGDQASLGHLVHEVEVDPLPARVEECELAARDAKGQQLNLTLKFSFIRFTDVAKNSK
jgi:hypothetical protein